MRRDRFGVWAGVAMILFAGRAWAQPETEMVQPVDVYIRSAKIALATNPPEYERAMRNLETARQHYPKNFEVHFLLGTVWAEKDEIDSMVAAYARAGQYAAETGQERDWLKKAKDLDKVLDSKWLDRFNRGVSYLQQSDSIEEMSNSAGDAVRSDSLKDVAQQIRVLAKTALRDCVLLKPADYRAPATRGIIYQREAMVDSALADLLHAQDLFHRAKFGDSTTNWSDTTAFFTGPEGEKTAFFKEYESKYKKLSEEDRTRYNNLIRSLGSAYYDAEKCPEAIAVYRRILALFAKDIGAIVTIADCFLRLGHAAEAYKWQESVVRENPDSKDTWYNMGIFYYNTAVSLRDSLLRAEESLERNAADAAAKSSRRLFWEKSLENYSKAIPRFIKVVELDPDDKDTWRLLARCYFSTALLAGDNGPIADRTEREAYLQKVWGFVNGAEAPFDSPKMWESCRQCLDKAVAFFPDEPEMCKLMKVTLAQLGRVDDLKTWEPKCP